MKSEITKPFKSLTKNDALIAGGKGASLGEMTNAGIPVPEGFVILSGVFDQFIQETRIQKEIDSILSEVKISGQESMESAKSGTTVQIASEKIQKLILEKSIPNYIKIEIEKSFKELGSKYVAVRSSATAEDGREHAWAGQLESYLNTTEADLLKNIQNCWASLFTARAIFYRFEKGLDKTHISVAVVVQKMINSEISGIAFSVHPVTENTNQVMIEASYGLGEAIVSGAITPDNYIIQKSPRKILTSTIAEKKRALSRNPDSTGGNIWTVISPEKISIQALNNSQILELTELVVMIENHYGFPCDIEWAYEEGKFYIVQCRPITTLSVKTPLQTGSESDKIEEYISTQKMESLGKRGADILEAKLKIIGWSSNLIKECGVGYKTMLINSTGEQFGDKASRRAMISCFENKDMAYVRLYIEKMANLDAKLVEEIAEKPTADYTEGLSYLLTYFYIIRWVIEDVYEKGNEEDKKYIDDWRNNKNLFNSFDKFYGAQPQSDPEEWSVVGIDGKVQVLSKCISYKLHSDDMLSQKEIKGSVGYPGVVTGKARVFTVINFADTITVEEGDIIVAPMTTLNFLPAMKKAAAFVTDEGGVTCHAAIVAREMKKPCIIATNIGTKVIKDGDTIEVDAENGIVRIL